MALTDVLSNIFNYFVQWHRDNYDALHKKTNDQIDDINNNKIGIKCTNPHDRNNRQGERFNPNGTLWDNLCNAWTTIGEWHPDEPNNNFENNPDWTGTAWGNETWVKNGQWTIKGWIRKLWVHINSLKSDVDWIKTGDWGLGAYAQNGGRDTHVWWHIGKLEEIVDSIKNYCTKDRSGIVTATQYRRYIMNDHWNPANGIHIYKRGPIGFIKVNGVSIKQSPDYFPYPLWTCSKSAMQSHPQFTPLISTHGSFSYDEARWIAVYAPGATYTYHSPGYNVSWNKDGWFIGIRTLDSDKHEVHATIVYPIDTSKIS